MRRILMCPPTYFGIEYEINPWMRRENAIDWSRAQEQWRGLHRVFLDLGVRVELVEQRPDVPDTTAEFVRRLHINALALRFHLDYEALLARWAAWARSE